MSKYDGYTVKQFLSEAERIGYGTRSNVRSRGAVEPSLTIRKEQMRQLLTAVVRRHGVSGLARRCQEAFVRGVERADQAETMNDASGTRRRRYGKRRVGRSAEGEPTFNMATRAYKIGANIAKCMSDGEKEEAAHWRERLRNVLRIASPSVRENLRAMAARGMHDQRKLTAGYKRLKARKGEPERDKDSLTHRGMRAAKSYGEMLLIANYSNPRAVAGAFGVDLDSKLGRRGAAYMRGLHKKHPLTTKWYGAGGKVAAAVAKSELGGKSSRDAESRRRTIRALSDRDLIEATRAAQAMKNRIVFQELMAEAKRRNMRGRDVSRNPSRLGSSSSAHLQQIYKHAVKYGDRHTANAVLAEMRRRRNA